MGLVSRYKYLPWTVLSQRRLGGSVTRLRACVIDRAF